MNKMNLSDKVFYLRMESKSEDDIRNYIKKTLEESNCSLSDIKFALENSDVNNYITLDLFSYCIDRIVESKSVKGCLKCIEIFAIEYSRRNDCTKLNECVLELIIDTNGYRRLIGRHLWDSLNLNDSDLDLLTNNEEFQMRFVLSILSDFDNPQKRLSKTLLFFNSDYSSVRMCLVNVLAIYAYNYYGTVKKYIDKTEINESDEYKQFSAFFSELDAKFKYMDKCKELLSDYSMPTILESCNRATQNFMKETMRVAERKRDSIVDKFMTKIALGKGGGWLDENGNVQQLAHIKFSCEMPIMLNALSPLEEHEFFSNMYLDWSTISNKNEK